MPDVRGYPGVSSEGGGLTLLRLSPDEVIPDEGRQLGLWGGASANDERAARAFARVQALLGPESVCTITVTGGRRPSDLVQLTPWGDERIIAPTALQPWPGRLPAPLPTTVYPLPLPIKVFGADGMQITVSSRGVISAIPVKVELPQSMSIEGSRSNSPSSPPSSSPSSPPSSSMPLVDRMGFPKPRAGVGGSSWSVGEAGSQPNHRGSKLLAREGSAAGVVGPRKGQFAYSGLETIESWAGPWPLEERWWDPMSARRQARVQIVTGNGAAYLLVVEGGDWWLEASYS